MLDLAGLRKEGVDCPRLTVRLHPDSWAEAPTVIHAELAPWNLIQIGAFTGVYGGRLGHCRIGRYCSIAPGVDIASDQHPVHWLSSSMLQYVDDIHGWGKWLLKNGHDYRPPVNKFKSNAVVTIGNDVWIGKGAIIKSGVMIGDGAIIAAGAVVVADVAAYSVVGGVPARVIKFRFPENIIQEMQDLRWWEYNVFGVDAIDFSNPLSAMDRLKELVAAGKIEKINLRKVSLADRPSLTVQEEGE